MSAPRLEAPELNPWQVGIGRPVNPASLELFTEAFEAIMPRRTGFVLREIPGVNYVPAEAFSELIANSSTQIEGPQVVPLARQIISSMCEKGKLAKTALEPAQIRMSNIGYKPDKPSVKTQIWDCKDPFYTSGYLFDGEKTAATEALHLEHQPSGRRPDKQPRSLLKLGWVSGPYHLVTNKHWAELRTALKGEKMWLEPVDVVTSS